ncbi:non-homologous end-joining DNA ligase [Streptomyces candidus]|uniref:DNA ligase (ATP) n=1 Tax=Streptomyces candidus TaxID=67283 RepID=A0A7X0HK32_9ACTN|nr:non-homologous end-joining DNA ligase [Streptomyces candidus]MBB6439120.1 bifunctional non-homologous end joining protein LigD [Streptomyces candidus]
MLAVPGALPSPAREHLYAVETKYDGMRTVVYAPGDGTLVLRSRAGLDATAAYPELHPLADALAGMPAVLDGEIVVFDEQGRPDFGRLQTRMGLASSPAKAARLAATTPVHLILFDALHVNGRSLLTHAYTDRRAVLEDLALAAPRWSTPASVTGHAREAFEATRAHGLEGIICKLLRAPYEPGVRSAAWLKVKHLQLADCVIGGWVPGRGALAGRPGALLLGEPQDSGGLRYVGSVGTGFTDRDRTVLARLLAVAAIDICPFTAAPAVPGARWVLPRLVAEIRYATRTRAGLLRHPSFHRLRPDLAPENL